MNKEDWIAKAKLHMLKRTGEWDFHESLQNICESLYETYVEEEEDTDFWTPENAVDEELTYWTT